MRASLYIMDVEGDTENRLLSEEKLRRLSTHGLESSHEDSLTVKRTTQEILATFKSPSVSSAHAAAAVNALCGLIDRLLSSKRPDVSSECLSERFQADLFSAYLRRSDILNAKPARRLLATATDLALGSSANFLKRLRAGILTDCVDALHGFNAAISVKASLQVLDILLNKLLLNAYDILLVDVGAFSSDDDKSSTEQTPSSIGSIEKIQVAATHFALQVFAWVRFPDCAPVISRFVPRFFDSLDSFVSKNSTNEDREGNLWLPSVKQTLERDPELLESFEHYILPGLLSLKSTDLHQFEDSTSFQDILKGNYGRIDDVDLQLCLLVAKLRDRSDKNNYVLDPSQPNGHQASYDLPKMLGLILIEHASPSIRLNALSLLVSPKSTSPFALDTLACFQRCIPYFHVEVEPKSRNEFIALMKIMAFKLRSIVRLLSRQDAHSLLKEHPRKQPNALAEHQSFVSWYTTYLISELRPTASYQSHITALKILSFFQNHVVKNQSSEILGLGVETKSARPCDDASIRCITDLLLNPFDDVRQAASSVLERMIGFNAGKASSLEILSNFKLVLDIALSRAEVVFRQSGRADHSDGFGRLHALLFGMRNLHSSTGANTHGEVLQFLLHELQIGIDGLQHNFPEAIKMSPLHGYLIALRYIFSRQDLETLFAPHLLQDIRTSIMQCCEQVWVAVRKILCNDAPEGQVIEDENVGEHDVGSKDSLSFCWRALKESSLLMRSLIEARPDSLPDNLYKRYGNLIFSQLAELRHTGAFSTVAQTFAQWCVICSQSSSGAVADLPAHWYQETLACIQIQSNALTRRSAGLPAMIVALLASSTTSGHFDGIIWDLQAIADAPVDREQGATSPKLPQVHALNCLKDVFTDARFGLKTEPHMATTFGISISCLESNIWVIKNCGLMLLNSLLRRINGGGDTTSSRISSSNRRGSPLVYEKYPLLRVLLQKLLHDNLVDHAMDASAIHKIFPALEIVERFGLPKIDHQNFLQSLERYRDSPSWMVREKAAKAMSFVLDPSRMIAEVQTLLARHWSSQNELHGRLLCLRFFLDRVKSENLQIGKGMKQRFNEQSPHDIDIGKLEILAKIGTLVHDFEIDLRQENICPENKTTLSNIIGKYRFMAEKTLDDDSICSICGNPLEPGTSATSQPSDFENSEAENSVPNLAGNSPCFCNAQGLTYRSPSRYRRQLVISGKDVGKEVANSTGNRKLNFLIGSWTRALLFALDENSEVSDRGAAVASFECFFQTLHQPQLRPTAFPEFFELFPVLCHVLVDDDSDIRRSGARIMSDFLSKDAAKRTGRPTVLNLSAAAAMPRLLKLLMTSYSGTRALLLESIWRVTGMEKHLDIGFRVGSLRRQNIGFPSTSSSILRLRAVSIVIEAAFKEQKVVFEEEKQNLYLEPVSESDAWTLVAMGMDTTIWSHDLCKELREWVFNGLEFLVDSLTISGDGPLGPCFKQDVFALFVQVLNAVRLVLHSAKIMSLPGDYEMQELVQEKLERLWGIGRKASLHPMILDRVGHLRLGQIHSLP